MPTASTFLLLTGAALALFVVPGPAVMVIVARSVEQGRSAGLTSAVGVALGSQVHSLFAALGLSVVLARSAALFTAVKLAGAAYLIVMGLRKLWARRLGSCAAADGPERQQQPLRRIFINGFVVNVLNPKTALFFLAFLPQFVDTRRGPAAPQILVLGLTFSTLGLCSDSLYALTASLAGERLRRRMGRSGGLDRDSGVIYVALGVIAAVARRPTSAATAR